MTARRPGAAAPALTKRPTSPYLTVDQEEEPAGGVTLAVAGEIDLQSAGVLAHAVEHNLRREPATLVVDLAAVTFLDAAGAGVLIDGYHVARERGVGYRIVGAPRIARRLLSVLGVYGLLTSG